MKSMLTANSHPPPNMDLMLRIQTIKKKAPLPNASGPSLKIPKTISQILNSI